MDKDLPHLGETASLHIETSSQTAAGRPELRGEGGAAGGREEGRTGGGEKRGEEKGWRQSEKGGARKRRVPATQMAAVAPQR